MLATSVALLVVGQSVSAAPFDDLVGQVSRANIEAHILALHGPRAVAAARARAADYIAQELQSYGYSVTRDPVLDDENIIARLPGTVTPERIFVVGAHFDTVALTAGADDNASGVAGMLELARVMASSSFGSTIDFVGFALEEPGPGLWGSRQYAQNAAATGVDVIGMVSLEMIAYTSDLPGSQEPFFNLGNCLLVNPQGQTVGDFIGVVGNKSSVGLVGEFVSAAATYAPTLPVTTGIVAGAGGCFPDTRLSDHAPFWDQRFEALLVTDTAFYRNPYYHLSADSIDKLDLDFATEVTRATLGMVATVVIPEPGSGWLAALGVLGLGVARRRNRR